MNVPKRKIVFPQRFGCYEKFPGTESEEDGDNNCFTKKVKKKHKIGSSQKSPTSSVNENCLPTTNQPNHENHLSDAESLNDEKKKHGANAYICNECGKVLRSNDTLSRHKISHSGSKPFLCDICDNGFSSAVSLKEHKAKHENKMLYECGICSKKFRQNSCYCRHMQTHSKTFSHVCHICNKQFALKDYLRSHMKKHTGEKNYKCNLCKKAFIHQSDLNRHRITHTGDRPYKCNVCGLTFTDNSSRRRHEKDHNDSSKKYACNQCSSQFLTKLLLLQHTDRNHKSLSPLPCIIKNNLLETDNFIPIDKVITNKEERISDGSSSKNTHFPSHCSEQISEVPTRISNSAKIVSNDYTNCEGFLESEGYNNNYTELEKSLQTVSVFRETLNVQESENIRDTNSENNNYNCFPEVETTSKSDYNNVELQSASQIDYVTFPDFNSQNYYIWLSDFTALCKLLTFPIDSELFNKISQVHKSIADVLANPLGVLSNKSNFKILRSISQDLLEVTDNHLNVIYERLHE